MVSKAVKQIKDEMEQIMSSADSPRLPKSGELVDGKIIYIGRNELLIDLGGLSTGLIRGHESFDESGEYSDLKVGDEISATVIEGENEKGLVELSIRRAGHKKAWDKLLSLKREAEVIEVSVLDANKGGLMIKLDQVTGFLPVSQLSPENYPRVVGGNKSKILEKLKSLVGSKMKVKIIDINDEEGTLIVSEREIGSDDRKKELAQYKKGDVVEGGITGVVDFGAFMEFGEGLEGLIHISEIGWQRIDNPKDVLKEGQKIKAQIIDISSNKVSLSLKRLTKDPWEKIKDKYSVGDKVKGKVIKEHKLGAFVEIEPDIQGLARFDMVRFSEDRTGKDEAAADKGDEGKKFEAGKEYKFEITNFEPIDHKLGLKLIK